MRETHMPVVGEVQAGSRFRPVHWSDISKPGAPIVGWGLEERAAGARRYTPRGYQGQIHPFITQADAQAVCDALNSQAAEERPNA